MTGWGDAAQGLLHQLGPAGVWMLGAYLALIALVVVVSALHPDPERRADARKVLDRLLPARLPRRRR